jgi:alkane 1-monooxygenase
VSTLRVAKYGIIYLLLGLVAITVVVGGWSAVTVPLFVFGLIPALDHLLGADESAPGERSWLHDALLRLWVPAQLGLIGFSLWTAGERPWWETAALMLGVGIATGAGGITIAHELVHRTSRLDRALAEILMLSVSYPWWCGEHVMGHHRWVATPRDPATARLGESVYAFLPRSVFGGLQSFVALEGDRTRRRQIRWWSLADRRTRHALSLVALYAGLLSLCGWAVAAAMLAQSVVAIGLLEVINYIEHYGLVRRETAPGVYERVKPEHSWNSNHWLTGAFLFNLPRHADHHAYASRPYWDLRPWPVAPVLPLGYAGMIVVALVPPLWFRWMDPRARALAQP